MLFRAEYIDTFLHEIQVDECILLGASMAGSYIVPLIFDYKPRYFQLICVIAVAITSTCSLEKLSNDQIESINMWEISLNFECVFIWISAHFWYFEARLIPTLVSMRYAPFLAFHTRGWSTFQTLNTCATFLTQHTSTKSYWIF